jgi:hypothetical protein
MLVKQLQDWGYTPRKKVPGPDGRHVGPGGSESRKTYLGRDVPYLGTIITNGVCGIRWIVSTLVLVDAA